MPSRPVRWWEKRNSRHLGPQSWEAMTLAMSRLVNSGVDLDTQYPGGYTYLWNAARSEHVDAVRLLLEHGANPNIPNKRGITPLIAATMYGDTPDSAAVVQALLAKGADVNAQDQWGDTALLIAAGSGFYHLVPLLLAQENIDIEARGDNGWTPLIAAAWAGWDDVVQMLLDAGANINAQASNRKTALMWAAQHGYDDVVRLLIQRGADLKFLIGRTRQL